MRTALYSAWANPAHNVGQWQGPSLLFWVRDEARKAKSEGGVLGEGAASPSPPARRSE